MVAPLLLLYLVSEIAALAGAVKLIGGLEAIALMACTSVGGYLLIRGEGIAMARRFAEFVQRAQATGQMPPVPLAESLPRFIAGFLFLLPGFVNDLFGILVLLPPVRGRVVERVRRFVAERQHTVLRQKGIIDVQGEMVLDPEDAPEPPRPPTDIRQPRRLPPPDTNFS